jgi:hypothetical protein
VQQFFYFVASYFNLLPFRNQEPPRLLPDPAANSIGMKFELHVMLLYILFKLKLY